MSLHRYTRPLVSVCIVFMLHLMANKRLTYLLKQVQSESYKLQSILLAASEQLPSPRYDTQTRIEMICESVLPVIAAHYAVGSCFNTHLKGRQKGHSPIPLRNLGDKKSTRQQCEHNETQPEDSNVAQL